MFHQFWLFCVYIWPSWPFVLPSVFCLSFVNNFTSSVRNFCRWVADVIPRESSLRKHPFLPALRRWGEERGETDVFAGYRETSSAAKSEEKRLFSQAMSSLNWFFWWVLYSTANDPQPQMIPNRKWPRDRKWSPKWTANDPRPQVIPKVDRKWSRKKNRNDLDSSWRIIVSILLLLPKRQIKS